MTRGPSIEATVSVHDQATAALQRIAREAQAAAKTFERMGASPTVTRNLDAANRALDAHIRQLARAESHWSRLADASKRIASNIAIMAAPAVLHGADKSLHLGAERVSEQFKLTLAGVRGAELERAKAQAQALQTLLPILDQTKLLERYKEIRSIVPTPAEAAHVLPMVARAEAAVLQSDSTGQAAQGLPWMLKAAEIAGFGQNIERMQRYLDGAVRAIQIMGKTVSFEQLADVVKYSGSAAPLLNEQFLNKTAAGLAQELGGSTAGLGIRSFFKELTGNLKGPNAHPALEEFMALGLVKRSDVDAKMKGLLPGHFIQGHDIAQHDPASWVWNTLIPALRAKGVTDKEDQIVAAQRLFPNSNAARLVEVLINQEETFKRHAALFDQAAGIGGALGSASKDPVSGAKALATAANDLLATLTSPAMEPAARIMNGLASNIASFGSTFAQFQKDHPNIAMGLAAAPVGAAGVAGYSLYNLGSGVLDALRGGSSLTAAGASLQTAAAELRAAAIASKTPGLGGGAATLAAAESAAEGGAAASRVGVAARVIAGLTSTPTVVAALGGLTVAVAAYAMRKDAERFDREQAAKRAGPQLSAYDEGRAALNAHKARQEYLRNLTQWAPSEIDPRGQGQFNRIFGTAEIIRAAAFDGARGGVAFGFNSKLSGKGYGDAPFTRGGGFPSLAGPYDRPSWPDIRPHESSWAVPKEISVQGNVTGEAVVRVEEHVSVNASPQFLATIDKRISEAGVMNLAGKLGQTMRGNGNSPIKSPASGSGAPLSSSFGFGAHGTK